MISYVVVQRVDPRTPDSPDKKFYGQTVDNGIVTLEDIARNISSRVTIQRADVEAALRAFVIVMRNNFLRGNSVRLDNVGVFKPTVKTSGSDTQDSWDTSYIKALNIRYRRAGAIREKLSLDNPDVTFQRVEKVGNAGQGIDNYRPVEESSQG